ncbi:MAG: RecQ family ATP-dependent DNA helicase [Phycisphaerales bacterium]|nr:RecQ family ATP-dependent DNA helicase [Phycisphaerales bacterium]
MTRQDAEKKLQDLFKIPQFYDEQWQTVEKVLKGEKVLLIEKTGFGKSLCFQFPATILQGTTVIFSPLIALMRDQVKKLTALGIVAKCINSAQTEEENFQILNEAKQGKIKILYIAPERQENSAWIEATQQMKLSMVVVDEAHCISVWGHDFRPSFKKIIDLVKLLPKEFPVLATTATATKKVERDITYQIGNNITTIRGNLMRDNLKLFVVKVTSEDQKLIWLAKNLNKLPGSGILYTGTQVDTDIYARWFEHQGISSVAYHGGLDKLDKQLRVDIEQGFMNNQWKCIASTNALGMGIDKPDIRFIIHTQIPQSPIHYYQEIGRAGRDGQNSYIILFYNESKDRELPQAFIEQSRPTIEKYEQVIRAVQSELLGEQDLQKRTNLQQKQIRTIKADLIEQSIIREVMIGKSKKYEYIANAPSLNTKPFEELRRTKLDDLDKMIAYVETNQSRMKFLCDYLGDNDNHIFNNCDNTGEKKITVSITPEWVQKLQDFRENHFPNLEVEAKGTHIVNGVAASYYGVSNVATALHQSKYEQGGDFPDFLLQLLLKAFHKKFSQEEFDLLLYVPPTSSGDLVKNFAVKVATALNIAISHNLVKSRVTNPQKVFQNNWNKKDNVRDAFSYTPRTDIIGKRIVLIDDIFDSGATVKEIGRLLTNFGAIKIAPIVIARTVGGDIA